MSLTLRQKKIHDFIKHSLKTKGVAPTQWEIARHFRLSSVATVHEHLQAIRKKGYLTKQDGQARGLATSKPFNDFVSIPLRGIIAAGEPIEGIETKETIAVPRNKVPGTGNLFALKVAGDSMIDENINNGDIVLVRQQNTAENGQKIVALIGNDNTTLKTFYKERGGVRLQPANKRMGPIFVDNDTDFKIQGVVVDIIKSNEQREISVGTVNTLHKKKSRERNIIEHLDKVYFGDVMDLLAKLPDNSVDMVFGDPDYNVGIKYGDNTYTKDFAEYIDWYIELTKEAMRVLKTDGNLFMMNYPQQNAHLRVKFLDGVYPAVTEYVWVYNTNVGHTPKRFTTAHRSILHVRKSRDNKFFKDEVAQPYKNPTDRRIQENLRNGSKGRMPYSWFEFNLVKNVSREKTYHACQIPQKLTELLIKASTKPGDIVFPLFGGSGSEVEVAKRLGRQFLSAELDRKYYDLIQDRLKKGYIDTEYKLGPRGRKIIKELSSAY